MSYRQQEIHDWAESRGIHEKSSMFGQFPKQMEEFTELLKAVAANDLDEIRDSIGDIYVVLVNGMWFEGIRCFDEHEVSLDTDSDVVTSDILPLLGSHLCAAYWGHDTATSENEANNALSCLADIAALFSLTFEECIDQAIDTILKRSGAMVNGTFVKDA